ncbi:prepilin peptidase [Brevundimonas sp. M20]|uniref:A24 family peptidase n=1 Tax=Brevundimonas sp. M20 TaxID=2591463 RepID=UPI001146E327|nr:prepilin peptidase [Brevundimonas sp. M20]QDH75090.1 pilus assembly protein CpaA [Brevundimonas sp. M20]
MDTVILALLGIMPVLVIVGGLNDLTTMKIPNWISGLLVLSFLPVAFISGLGPVGFAVHLGVGFAALVVGAGMFALRWIGGGDAKLMAAACLWLGLQGSGMFLVYTGLMGGLFCLFLMLARGHSRPYLAGAPGWVVQLMEPKGDIPYGVAIAAGALLAYPASPLVALFISR